MGPVELLKASGKTHTSTDIVTTCVSLSADTIAIVAASNLWVFRMSKTGGEVLSSEVALGKKDFYKRDGMQRQKPQEQPLVCAAVSDRFLAVASRRALLLYSIVGRLECVSQFWTPDADWAFRKLLLNEEEDLLVAICSNQQREKAQMFSVHGLAHRNQTLTTSSDPRIDLRICQVVEWPLAITVNDKLQDGNIFVRTKHAILSSDGNKIALCSENVAVIRILIKGAEGKWQCWCSRSYYSDWEPTGISLYNIFRERI